MKKHTVHQVTQISKSVAGRRQFISGALRIVAGSVVLGSKTALGSPIINSSALGKMRVTTTFEGAGGMIEKVDQERRTIRFRAHREQDGGWGQVWWYFCVDELIPGEEITLELNLDTPPSLGIAPQAYYSKDQKKWQMTPKGRETRDGETNLFVYHQKASGSRMWFAYNVPYLPHHAETLMSHASKTGNGVKVYELCRTVKGRSVKGLEMACISESGKRCYSIWLQARSHAFESGTSWVLQELTLWLISSDPQAKMLRSLAHITIVPIVDVDSVLDGRTGKNQLPHDHNRDWQQEPAHWPEIRAIKERLKIATEQNNLDLFIDIHGPGNGRYPYFITQKQELLKHIPQQKNQAAFFKTFEAEALSERSPKTPSMTQFFYSPRDVNHQTATGWVINNTTESVVAHTIEINMSSPLSTPEGYREEGVALGRGIAKYFIQGLHIH